MLVTVRWAYTQNPVRILGSQQFLKVLCRRLEVELMKCKHHKFSIPTQVTSDSTNLLRSSTKLIRCFWCGSMNQRLTEIDQ